MITNWIPGNDDGVNNSLVRAFLATLAEANGGDISDRLATHESNTFDCTRPQAGCISFIIVPEFDTVVGEMVSDDGRTYGRFALRETGSALVTYGQCPDRLKEFAWDSILRIGEWYGPQLVVKEFAESAA